MFLVKDPSESAESQLVGPTPVRDSARDVPQPISKRSWVTCNTHVLPCGVQSPRRSSSPHQLRHTDGLSLGSTGCGTSCHTFKSRKKTLGFAGLCIVHPLLQAAMPSERLRNMHGTSVQTEASYQPFGKYVHIFSLFERERES